MVPRPMLPMATSAILSEKIGMKDKQRGGGWVLEKRWYGVYGQLPAGCRRLLSYERFDF